MGEQRHGYHLVPFGLGGAWPAWPGVVLLCQTQTYYTPHPTGPDAFPCPCSGDRERPSRVGGLASLSSALNEAALRARVYWSQAVVFLILIV